MLLGDSSVYEINHYLIPSGQSKRAIYWDAVASKNTDILYWWKCHFLPTWSNQVTSLLLDLQTGRLAVISFISFLFVRRKKHLWNNREWPFIFSDHSVTNQNDVHMAWCQDGFQTPRRSGSNLLYLFFKLLLRQIQSNIQSSRTPDEEM